MNTMMPNIIISLTSFPARITTVSLVIKSLLEQTVKPWKIVLWLTREEFPDGERSLPSDLLALTKDSVFEIDWSINNRAYTKLLPALRKYPDCAIVTVDDDIIYAPDTLELLLSGYADHPHAIQALRVHIITSQGGRINPYVDWIWDSQSSGIDGDNFLTGCGGVLYPPGCLGSRVLDIDLAKKLTPLNDDIWYWAMAILNKTPINAIAGRGRLNYIFGTQKVGLCYDNVDRGENDQALKRIFATFPEVKERLPLTHPPLPKATRIFGGFIRSFREGNRNFSIRLNIPLFQMKYSEDFSTLTYYVLKIPVFRKRCAPESSGSSRS